MSRTLLCQKYANYCDNYHVKRISQCIGPLVVSCANQNNVVETVKQVFDHAVFTDVENSKDIKHASNMLETVVATHVLLVKDADRYKKGEQRTLCSLLDKYSECVMFVFIVSSISRLNCGIKSRCTYYRFSPPSRCSKLELVNHVLRKESMTLSNNDIEDVCKCSCFWEMLVELDKIRCNARVHVKPWIVVSRVLVQNIEKTPHKAIRKQLYAILLMTNNITGLFTAILDECLKRYTEISHSTMHWCAHYEHMHNLGNKAVYYLEAFLFQVKYLLHKNGNVSPKDFSEKANCG
jgi:hypothetical protein